MSSDEEEVENDPLKVVGTYKHGSIRRIKLHNFLTYSDVECRPGPRLNMVVGPNGTGKSTILCAICLGLGGEPRLLGRASDVETFVANGEDIGSIEIELESELEEENPVIKRIIRRNHTKQNPRSSYFLNNEPISGKKIRSLVLEKYNISVDNLCTFLPQDRVGSFSGFDSKQLLMETERSLSSDQHLYHTHMELIEAQQELQAGNSNVETLKEKVDQLKAEHQRLEKGKALMEERDLALEQANMLRKKVAWLRYDEAAEKLRERSVLKKELKAKRRGLEAELVPLTEQHSEKVERLRRADTRYKTMNQQVEKHRKEMKKQVDKYDKHDENIENTMGQLNALDTHRAKLEQDAQRCREKVESLHNEAKEVPALETLENDYQEARQKFAEDRPEWDKAKREHRSLHDRVKDVDRDRKVAKDKLNNLLDDKARRKERIFRQQRQLGDVSKWIDQNRNMFRRKVWGPIVCEINPKSRNTAAYLEQHIPNSILKSFVVEDKEDYDKLYKQVREQLKLPINIVLVKNGQLEPPRARLYSDTKMGVLKKEHGVIGYMDEAFEAPDAVLQALKTNARVHDVLVGTQQTQDSLDNKSLLEYLIEPEGDQNQFQSCCIFACQKDRSYKYQSNISKYSGKPSTRVDDVKPAMWLAPGVSDETKQKAQEEFEQLEGEFNRIVSELEAAQNRVAETQEAAQNSKHHMNEMENSLKLRRRLNNKVKNAEQKLRQAEKELEKDDDDEKQRLVTMLKKGVAASINALENHADSQRLLMETTYKVAGVRLDRDVLSTEERRAKEAMEDKRADVEEARREYDKIDRQYKRELEHVKSLKEEAEEMAPLVDDDGEPNQLKAELDELGVMDLGEAEAALEEAEKIANDIVADPDVLRQYESVQKELDDAQFQLDDLTGSKQRKMDELKKRVEPWKTALTNSVQKVDALFSRYMSELGYTGGVSLYEGENSDDDPDSFGNFKDWGIQIKVSFREGVKAQVLSSRVQSGGERSVSTIMYLMALQGMMVSPFRCVDEINQGLDDRNERFVFRRIVENSTEPPKAKGPTDHDGQYFLITPKLLPNLYDMEVEGITVLFIFNGPFNFKSPKDWDIPRFLEMRKRRLAIEAEENEGGNDENTPNSQSERSIPKKAKRSRRSES